MNVLNVGMAEIKITTAPDCLVTNGLGSCIGLCMYDPVRKLGGMVHIVLPTVTGLADRDQGGKYAVTAVPLLVEKMLGQGATKQRLVAKIAGGAEMFSFPGQDSVLKIGKRNAEAVTAILRESGIPLAAADVGGNFGRTIQFDTNTGMLKVKTINHGEKVI
ncbi:MAG: chemotaxis protein CheD [Peptococcaceae bacterium]|nr:chemotaxis protein CheD [Peptococcaceae bacterium]